MLPTFVIGLREGLEAALIVGIVAAFLRQRGRTDLLRWAFAGVAAAVVLCLAIGIALDVVSHELPQRQQEGLETVIGAFAVVMVTYMVVWMRRHSRTLKAQLEGAAGEALAAGSGFALVVMAFLAVLREGLETVVFLLAAFNQTGSGPLAATGAVLGILLAIVLGWGIYRGGVQLNLSKFFRITGVVLTFVAAGLVVSALHTAHEAGWLDAGQQSTVDLSALVRSGSVQAALLTGMLGVQPHPVVIEVVGWLVYLVPVGLYIAWPPGRGLSKATVRRALVAGGGAAIVAAVVLTVLMPSGRTPNPVTRSSGGAQAQLISSSDRAAIIAMTVVHPAQSGAPVSALVRLSATPLGRQDHLGLVTEAYSATVTEPVSGAAATMTFDELAARNGGRLPLGVRATNGTDTVDVRTVSLDSATVWIEPRTGRVVDVQWGERVSLNAEFASIGATVIGTPTTATWKLPAAAVQQATNAARADRRALDRRSLFATLAIIAGVAAGLCALALAGLLITARRRRPVAAAIPGPAADEPSGARPIDVAPVTPRSELVGS